MYVCIILHIMIAEDNRQSICDANEFYIPSETGVRRPFHKRVSEHIMINKELKDKDTHYFLRLDLVERI